MKKNNVGQPKGFLQFGSWISLPFAALIMSMSSLTQAATINLMLNDAPDIVSTAISVSYDAGFDAFTASGFANELDYIDDVAPEAAAAAITGGTFDIDASIFGDGTLNSGSFVIGGTIASLGFNSNILLTGDLTVLGFGAGDTLEFLFDVTGGDAAGLYGSSGGIILGNSGFGGDWTSDFNTSFTSVSDTGTLVPVPAAAWLFGSGLLGLVGFARRKQLA